MIYHIDKEFKKHMETIEIIISDLLTEKFCNQIKYNSIQKNSENPSVLKM